MSDGEMNVPITTTARLLYCIIIRVVLIEHKIRAYLHDRDADIYN